MRRLNANITEEAFEVLQSKAKRYGAPMGTVLTMMLLETKRQDVALESLSMYKAEVEKKGIEQPR